MPDNSFEHNLSRQMEDFHYPASAAVWQKLEANLQQRKKRRWAIIWFFSGLMLVSAGLYFMASPADPIKGESLVSNNLKAGISENRQVSPINKSIDSQKKENKTVQKEDKKSHEQKRRKIIVQSSQYMVVDSNTEKGVEVGKKEKAVPDFTSVPMLEKVREEPVIETPETDSVTVPKSSDSLIKTDLIAVAKIPPSKETSKHSLSFGIRFEAGRSANGQSSLQKTYTNNLTSSPTAGGPIAIPNAYSQEPSFGWSIGVWVRKPQSNRINLLTGLLYNNYRTSTPVGAPVQGGILISNAAGDRRTYYQQGNAANYQNNYHLLSVPLEMGLQLNKGEKLPVSWVLGIEPGWMIGSNAVIKDTSGYLYNDKSMYNRFQFGLQTGISFGLFQKSKHALELGPVFRYILTPAFKNGSDYNGHLNFLGLRADWKIFNQGLKQR